MGRYYKLRATLGVEQLIGEFYLVEGSIIDADSDHEALSDIVKDLICAEERVSTGAYDDTPNSRDNVFYSKYAKIAFQVAEDFFRALNLLGPSNDVNQLIDSIDSYRERAFLMKSGPVTAYFSNDYVGKIKELVGDDLAQPLCHAARIALLAQVEFTLLGNSSLRRKKIERFLPEIYNQHRAVYLDCLCTAMTLKFSLDEKQSPSPAIESAIDLLNGFIENVEEVSFYLGRYLDNMGGANSKQNKVKTAFKVDKSRTWGVVNHLVSAAGLMDIGAILNQAIKDNEPPAMTQEAGQSRANVAAPQSNETEKSKDGLDFTADWVRSSTHGIGLPKDGFSKLSGLITQGKELLDHHFDSLESDCLAGEGVSDPDITYRASHSLADRMQDSAKKMKSLANRLQKNTAKVSESDFGERESPLLASSEMVSELRSQALKLEGRAKNLRSDDVYFSLIKAYPRPKAEQWHELLKKGEIESVSDMKYLPSDPEKTLIEVKIQSKNDLDGRRYPPVFLHIHTHAPLLNLEVLPKLPFTSFAAVHLKSNEQKNFGRKWVESERALGNNEATVHRSPIHSSAILKDLLQEFEKSPAHSG